MTPKKSIYNLITYAMTRNHQSIITYPSSPLVEQGSISHIFLISGELKLDIYMYIQSIFMMQILKFLTFIKV